MEILVEDKILIRLHLLLPNPPGITRRSDQGPPQEPGELTLHPLDSQDSGKEVILHQMARDEVIHLQEVTDLEHHLPQEVTDLEHHLLQEVTDLKHHQLQEVTDLGHHLPQEVTDLGHHHLQEGIDLRHHLQEGSDLNPHHRKDLDTEHLLQTPTSIRSIDQSHHHLIQQGAAEVLHHQTHPNLLPEGDQVQAVLREGHRVPAIGSIQSLTT